jgi:mono/diheme cytochrome c family protein
MPSARSQIAVFVRMFALAFCVILPGVTRADDEKPATQPAAHPGEAIYRDQCASCHGDRGEGTDDYKHALVGDRSIFELKKFIHDTMPKDSAEDCIGDDAEQVAKYIHAAFYSKDAQARIHPPRIELSRLTVRQYRNALADLIGSFGDKTEISSERGLSGEYFKTSRPRGRNRDREIERVDATVAFDFKDSSPEPEKIKPEEFSARWRGSVFAPDTGEYEFIVKTENGTRLWVNDDRTPLIDAGVKSGDDREFRGTIWLIGGRWYPLRLEFYKSKEPTASISLWWKPPHLAPHVIGERNLSTARAVDVFASATPFPPDDKSVGYERGTFVSKAWDAATTEAAIETTAYVTANLRELAGVSERDDNREKRLREFAHKFVERAFRRPLSDDEKTIHIYRQFEEAGNPDAAVKRVVLLALKSPRFLYRELATDEVDSHEVAERLALGLWDSLPDEELRKAAAAGELKTREQVANQAKSMAADPRAKAKLRQFLLLWLRVDQPPELSKDKEKFADFDADVASDLRRSLELSLDEVIDAEKADFRRLIASKEVWLNGRLSKIYGIEASPDAPFAKAKLDDGQRAGVLSHPYLMASFAYTAASSPIHRGVFLSRSLLGRALRQPPEAVAPLAPDLHADLSTRDRVALQTSPQACQMCHEMINPLGFALENFDALGRYRKEEQGKPIDATGQYLTRSGETRKFAGPRELADFLVQSDETHEAFVEQLFHYLVQQPIRAYGNQTLPELKTAFARNEFDIRAAMVEIMAASALQSRNVAATTTKKE